jgi:predicted SAM-dependent methyltransferase
MQTTFRQTVKGALKTYPRLSAAVRESVYAARGLYGNTVGRILATRARGYLETAEESKLHLGCGDLILAGWLNSDAFPRRLGVVYCNATKQFPFPDNSFAYVFTEHMIEHLPQRGGENLVRESFRVLRPGGRVRIATPDLNKIIALKRSGLSDTEREYLAWQTAQIPSAIEGSACFTINTFVRAWGHAFIYDFDTLKQILERNGYTDVQEFAPGESDVPALRSVEHHAEIFPNPAFNLVETMVVEAAKPAASDRPALG